MNFSSERALRRLALASVALGLAAPPAAALQVHAVYRSACDRLIGVIMRVDRREIHLMDLEGRMQTVPRHEIVSLAYYPVASLPLRRIAVDAVVRPLAVRAVVDDRIEDLVVGWPVDYSDEKIAFLGRDGRELVIARDSIWALAFAAPAAAPPAIEPGATREVYVHPQAAGFCEDAAAAPLGDAVRVFPQQFLNDEVVIKHELDRLQAGYEQVLEYENDQKFYPVPQLYWNRTSLGLWLPFGSRYGASKRRTNIAPLLVDELSLGPFRYQHVFLTGSAPGRFFLHEEPQTQIYYRFKAAYFHASVMLDPAIVLVGEKYAWQADDFEGTRADDRLNDSFAIDLGFDFGPLALQLFPVVVSEVGFRAGDDVHTATRNLLRAGPRLTLRKLELELLGGFNNEGERHRYLRVNADVAVHRSVRAGGTLILRRLHASGGFGDGAYEYDSETVSFALHVAVTVARRFTLEAYGSVESKSTRYRDGGEAAAASDLHPKLGVATSFAF